MQIRELSIRDSYEITPLQHSDDRGLFLEWYRFDELEAVVGHALVLRQANVSVSKRGVVRGVHYADVPKGQAKYVTAVHGAVLDYVVDIRVGSPTFGQWDRVRLDDVSRKAVYLAEGLGHAFVALTDNATVTYLVSGVYDPLHEHGINPLDAEIGLDFSTEVGSAVLSPKDTEAPTLANAREAGLLPDWDEVQSFYGSLTAVGR